MNIITGNKFKNLCDFVLDENGFIKTNKDNEIKIFFVKTDYLDLFFSKYKPNHPFILLTHNSDYHINISHLNYLNDSFLLNWYAQNVDISHPKLKSIPIGIANERWEHGNINIFEKIIKEENKKNNLTYCNFNINTNLEERSGCLNVIKKLEIKVSPSIDFENYLREVSKSYFVISPNGNGVDCHKTWESLYLKSIPIVTESININFYKNLPILIIKNWESLDINYLTEKNYKLIWDNFNPETLTCNSFLL